LIYFHPLTYIDRPSAQRNQRGVVTKAKERFSGKETKGELLPRPRKDFLFLPPEPSKQWIVSWSVLANWTSTVVRNTMC